MLDVYRAVFFYGKLKALVQEEVLYADLAICHSAVTGCCKFTLATKMTSTDHKHTEGLAILNIYGLWLCFLCQLEYLHRVIISVLRGHAAKLPIKC